jgi:hypothetical protein
MDEILPGVWHWTQPNPSIGDTKVSSYWLDSGVFIDPLLPSEGLDWFAERPSKPQAVVLCNRHHYRQSGQIHERYDCLVHVPSGGLHNFTEGQPVAGYNFGDALPGDLVAVEVGSLSPDEGGLYLESMRALWLADTVVREPTDPEAEIGWVPDFLMDEPEKTKQGLLVAYTRLLDELEFEHLLLAHGQPLIGNGRSELERLVSDGGRVAPAAF